MQSNKNNDSENKEFNLSILEKISKLVGDALSFSEVKELENKMEVDKVVDQIIAKNNTNKNLALFLIGEISSDFFKKFDHLHADKAVVNLALRKDSSLFYSLNTELRKDAKIGLVVLDSMIREGKNFFEIDKFIEINFPKNKKVLFKHYKKLLELADKSYSNDITKTILLLKTQNQDFYNKLLEIGVFQVNSEKIVIKNDFVNSIYTTITNNDEYSKLAETEKKNYLIIYLEKLFGINYLKLDKNEKYLIDSIIKLVGVKESKEKVKEKKLEEIEEESEEIEEKKTTKSKKEIKDEFCDVLEFSTPECRSYSVSGGYNLETNIGKTIFITTKEKQKFTSKALTNFVNFYNTMNNLGLSFLWDKYSHDFKILCNNKFGFDYMSGEGITESKTLSVLNMVGKNVGIPEYSELDGNGKKTGVLRCFKTLGDAKMGFSEIKETGIINEKKYSDGSAFGNGAVENKLIEVLCIDQKGSGLNITKWK